MDGNNFKKKDMKKIASIIIGLLLLISCSNQEITYPDYEYNAVYFPLQYPLRTLILGESISDNSLDKNLQFHIGASIGGLRENKKDWEIDYEVDYSLVPPNLTTSTGKPLEVLPEKFYTLSPENKITISKGQFNGLILVQLTEGFLNDPLAITGNYVIPLRMTSTNADSILIGFPFVENPNRLIDADWEPGSLPKDFVLFGIKYINPYHGNYFHRGKDVGIESGDTVSFVTYHQQYVEKDQLWSLVTTAKNAVQTNGVGSKFDSNSRLLLEIDENGSIVIKTGNDSNYPADGVGRYVEKAEVWGGEKHHALYLNYTYKEGTINHVVTDTLVFRDNGVKFEDFKVELN